jgi:hypothetical protein
MTARLEGLVLALGIGGCTLLFKIGEKPAAVIEDGGVPDAEAPPALDAAVIGECPERSLLDRTHDDCLGCGDPCGPKRPFCCMGTCCEEECGTVANTCSTVSEPQEDAGFEADADADGDADGCDHHVYETCLGCDRPCTASYPFCCGSTCCQEECGAVPNQCWRGPQKQPGFF